MNKHNQTAAVTPVMSPPSGSATTRLPTWWWPLEPQRAAPRAANVNTDPSLGRSALPGDVPAPRNIIHIIHIIKINKDIKDTDAGPSLGSTEHRNTQRFGDELNFICSPGFVFGVGGRRQEIWTGSGPVEAPVMTSTEAFIKEPAPLKRLKKL